MSKWNRRLNRRHRLAVAREARIIAKVGKLASKPKKLSEMTRPELAAVNDRNMHAAPNQAHLASALSPLTQADTGTCDPAAPLRALPAKRCKGKSRLPEALRQASELERFVVEECLSGNQWTRVPKSPSADLARKLHDFAAPYARKHPGRKIRIIRRDNDRAVARFCWKQAADSGQWYLGSYST